MAVTLRDVASRAGVSVTSVAHVLNGYTKSGIKLETQERVRRAAAELGYRPNHLARSLSRGRTNTIGIVAKSFDNPFYAAIIRTAERMVVNAGYHALASATHYSAKADSPSEFLTAALLDGIFVCEENWTYAASANSAAPSLPKLIFGDWSGTKDEAGVDYITIDLYSVATQMMAHLREREYVRVAYVIPIPQSPYLYDDRYRAYQEFCQNTGCAPEIISNEENLPLAAFGRGVGAILSRRSSAERPRALFCLNDLTAIAMYQGLRAAGLSTPGDIALAGVDGIDTGLYLDKTLTTVKVPLEDACRQGVDMLLSRIAGDSATPSRRALITPELFVGDTT